MNMKKVIDWIIFDVSGVLTQFTFGNSDEYSIGNARVNTSQLEKIYKDPQYRAYMLGDISHKDFVKGFLAHEHIDMSVEQFDRIFLSELEPMPGMKDLVRSLSTTYSIAVASNEGSVLSEFRMEASGVMPYVAKRINSCDIKLLKSDSAFFQKMLEILNSKPEKCVFIDDDEINVKAAKSCGIHAIIFDTPAQLDTELKRIV